MCSLRIFGSCNITSHTIKYIMEGCTAHDHIQQQYNIKSLHNLWESQVLAAVYHRASEPGTLWNNNNKDLQWIVVLYMPYGSVEGNAINSKQQSQCSIASRLLQSLNGSFELSLNYSTEKLLVSSGRKFYCKKDLAWKEIPSKIIAELLWYEFKVEISSSLFFTELEHKATLSNPRII